MPDSVMTLDADATGLVSETKKGQQAFTDLDNAVKKMVEQSTKGHQQIIDLLVKEGTATRSLLVENENLKAKIKEMKETHDTFVESANKGVDAMKGLAEKAMIGEAIAAIKQLVVEQNELNKTIAETQIAYDKQAVKARMAMMMSRPDFEKYRQEQIFPMTQQFKVSEETATQAFIAASNVNEKDRAGVVKESLAAGKAAGVDESSIIDFQKALMTRLRQEGKEITAENVRASGMALANIGGQGGVLKMSGSDLLSAQQQIGKIEGVDQNQMLAQFATLVKQGGFDPGKAGQQLGMIATNLHALPEAAQKALGPELTKAIQEQMGRGDIMGTIDTLKQSMDAKGIKGADRAQTLETITGRRALPALERLMSNQDFSRSMLGKERDEAMFNQQLNIGTQGAAATDTAINAAHQEAQLQQQQLIEKNQAIMKIVEDIGKEKHLSSGEMPLVGGLGLWGRSGTRGRMMQRDWMGKDILEEMQKDKDQDRYSPVLPGSISVDEVRQRYEAAERGAQGTVSGSPQMPVPMPRGTAVAGAFERSELDKAKEQLKEAQLKKQTDEIKFSQEAHHDAKGKAHLRNDQKRALNEDDDVVKRWEAAVKALELLAERETKSRGRNATL